ncbi:MAG: hypothetical protein HDQ97_02930 [Lachnospiraceae bacterium]|nr:hypothetical protein [Lachnospiraceae bacterium]
MEQEIQEQQDIAGKGKKQKLRLVVIAALTALMMCFSACSASGGPYTVTIGGVDVKPGVTTLQELEDAGYGFANGIGMFDRDENGILTDEFIYPTVYDLSSMAEANTIYIAIALVKDKKKVADVTVVNESAKSIPLSECIIESVEIDRDDYEADKVLIEGIEIEKVSEEAVTEVVGKAAKTPSYGDDCTWKRGAYSLGFKYNEDGTLKSVSSGHMS